VWLVARDPNDPARRLFLPVKNNLSSERTGLALQLANLAQKEVPRVDWSSELTCLMVDEALTAARRKPGLDAETLRETVEFLQEVLADRPRLVKEVEQEAKERGISSRSVRRGRVVLNLRPYRKHIPGPWWLDLAKKVTLAEEMAQRDEDIGHLGHLGKNTGKSNISDNGSNEPVGHLADEAELENLLRKLQKEVDDQQVLCG
jgi:hypothetical protein